MDNLKELEQKNQSLYKYLLELEETRDAIKTKIGLRKIILFCEINNISPRKLTVDGIAVVLEFEQDGPYDPKLLFNRMQSEGMGWV